MEKKLNLGALPCTIRAILGESECTVDRLADIGKESVILLDQEIGESVLLEVNGLAAYRGEVVVLGNRLGVRIKEHLLPGAETDPGAEDRHV